MNAPLRQLLELIESGGEIHETLAAIARWTERESRALCSILLLDETGANLRCGASPTLAASFAAAIEGIAIDVTASPFGTAVHRRAPVLTRDIVADPLWSDHRALAAEHGLRSAWSFPVVSEDGRALGTLSLYSLEPQLPDEWQMHVAGMGAVLATMAIERTHSHAPIQQSEARYRLLWETSTDAVLVMDETSRIESVNPAVLEVFGYAPEELIGQDLAMLQPEHLRVVHRAGLRRYLETGARRADWHAVRTTGLHKDGHEFPIEIAFSEASVEGTRQFGAFIRDVTQRSLVEEALKQGEARYRALAENALDLVCELDAEGRFSYASPNFRTVLGYEPSDLLGRSAFELIHPDDQARVGAEFAGAIADPTSGTITFRLRRADGSWTPLDVGANVYHNEAGEARAVIVARDIGERMALEAAMHEGEVRLRTFMDNAPLIFFATDAAGMFTLYEGAGLERVGLRPGQFVGRAVADVHRDTPRIVENMKRVLAGESFTDIVDIGPISFEAHHTPLKDASGAITGMAGVLIDATARVRAEAALRASNGRLQTFMQNAPVILFATDSEGVFTMFDGKGMEPLGIVAGQLVGQSLFETLGQFPDIVNGARQALAGETVTYLFRGQQSALEVHQSPVRDDAGEVTGTIGLVLHVGDRLRAEEALRESEQRVRTIVTNAPLILFATDKDGVFTLYDGAGLRRIGQKPGEFVGQSVFDVYAQWPEIVEAARRAQEGESLTYVFQESGIALEVHLAPARDTRGDMTGVIGVAIDVSERAQAQEALHKSEARYKAIFETHRVVRLLVDPATGLIEEANQAASVYYGYSVEEMAGMPISTISTSPAEQILENVRGAGDGDSSVLQRKHRLKSGELRDVELFAAPVEVEGRTLLYGIVQDVTERRWAETMVATQRQLLEMVAVGTPLTDVLERLALAFEEHAPGALCSVLLLSPDGTQLQHAAAPSLPAAYAQAIDGVVIGPMVGSCGTAAYLRHEIVVDDIGTDPLWTDFRDLALAHGLQSCWSTPILSGTGEVLATFAVYHRVPGGVRQRERSLLEIATHVAGIAIERDRLEKAARSRTEELERMYRQLAEAHADLEESKARLEEKSALLEVGLALERERSSRDQLTGALNHAAIADEMRAAIATGGGASLAVAMVDVDGLKAANDTYGHQVGDAVLVLVAEKLARGGAIVGRYGGDEFVAIIPGADRVAAERYRDDVLASLVGAGLIDEQTGAHVPVVASIGLAVYPEEAEAVDDLIRLSDSAMYASRRLRADHGTADARRSLGGDRAAKMVGEIVPLLTSPGALDDKLRLVAHRLSVGAGYDGVNFLVEGLGQARQASSATNEHIDADDLEEWSRRQLHSDRRRIAALLIQTKKPIIIDDIESTELLPEIQREALVSGGLRSTLVAPMIWQGRLIGALSVASKHRNAFTVRDVEFLGAVATQVTAIVRMSSLVEELQVSTSQLQQAHEGTVLMLASAAEAHDHTTGRHLQRVRAISEAIAREMGYDDDRASALGMAATLHDIGKIRVPDSVLGSSNSLAAAEWVLMKQHTLWGAAFLSEQPGFELAASVARHHHERWDGAGYPDGLAGEEIPESALITTVADSFDAMTNHRPYRRGRPVDEAVREIVSCSGTQFSPRIVDALVRLFDRGDLAFVHPDEDLQDAA